MAMDNPIVIETASTTEIFEALSEANCALETITDGVNTYLEKKRLYFSRFFFLSNDEMLEILSETNDPLRVQPHLIKCFEGIFRLEFDGKLDILSMISSEKERIEFVALVSTSEARGSVEIWLLCVEHAMRAAVRKETSLSLSDYEATSRNQWILKWPQMIVLCISQIYWAANVEACLQGKHLNGLKALLQTLQTNINDIVGLIRSKDITNLNRITLRSLIVIDVHAKDIVADLCKFNVVSIDDFEWLAQLRYYWVDGDVHVRIINASIKFACEYLGNSDRLVGFWVDLGGTLGKG